ncbi:hypothetical protein SDC9_124403 [bioreactor metagenome]|uniref:Helix-turn-helix domain-containing protein n=1 Tax=bioreactor metagenome TaxID=1076179 RepID=A0A645CKB0_9ZZZZ
MNKIDKGLTLMDRVVNDKELARAIDPTGKIVTPWTIRNWRLQGGMPSFRVGNRIFFRLESVLRWMDSREAGIPESAPASYGKLRRID